MCTDNIFAYKSQAAALNVTFFHPVQLPTWFAGASLLSRDDLYCTRRRKAWSTQAQRIPVQSYFKLQK